MKRTYQDEAVAIRPRDVHFDWDDVPLHYVTGEPLATHLFNVMHLTLPEGERAMAKALADALPLVRDERLHEEMVGFIGQEGQHAHAHQEIHALLAGLGLDVAPLVSRLEWLIDNVMNRDGLRGRAKEEWLKERLALSAALEHYTAVLGQWILDAEALDDAMHPTMLDLCRWHGAEEVEHRNVAYDAYQYVDGSYLRRARTGVMASVLLAGVFAAAMVYLVHHDPSEDTGTFWPLQLARAVRRGVIPSMTHFVTEIPVYLRPGFHPSQMGSLDAALRYLARSPGAQAGER